MFAARGKRISRNGIADMLKLESLSQDEFQNIITLRFRGLL